MVLKTGERLETRDVRYATKVTWSKTFSLNAYSQIAHTKVTKRQSDGVKSLDNLSIPPKYATIGFTLRMQAGEAKGARNHEWIFHSNSLYLSNPGRWRTRVTLIWIELGRHDTHSSFSFLQHNGTNGWVNYRKLKSLGHRYNVLFLSLTFYSSFIISRPSHQLKHSPMYDIALEENTGEEVDKFESMEKFVNCQKLCQTFKLWIGSESQLFTSWNFQEDSEKATVSCFLVDVIVRIQTMPP